MLCVSIVNTIQSAVYKWISVAAVVKVRAGTGHYFMICYCTTIDPVAVCITVTVYSLSEKLCLPWLYANCSTLFILLSLSPSPSLSLPLSLSLPSLPTWFGKSLVDIICWESQPAAGPHAGPHYRLT